MNDTEKTQLVELRLAPYIQKATALIGLSRKVGGNQFRHAIATFGILLDYHIMDPVILKASVIHDLIEDVENYNHQEIFNIDSDGPEVLNLVLEVSKGDEPKEVYLQRILETGSTRAKILKVADRISNLTDLHDDIFGLDFIERYLNETEKYVLPIAEEVNFNMAIEVRDLIKRRRKFLYFKRIIQLDDK
ncbi:MAG: hypothetical protein V1779_10115 [bacterium]